MGCSNAPIVVPPLRVPPPDPVIMNNSAVLPMVEDPSFRKEPPQPEADVRFVPPKIEEARLSNGLRILVAERRDMPIVAMQIVVDRGLDLQTLPGVATMTATMMLTGTKSRSALALSDDLAAIGARYGAWADHDGMGVRGQALRERFPELFAILVDVVRNPAFDGVELERERAKRLTTLAAQTDVPDVLMENAVEEKLYPLGHPYHAPLNGDEASTKAIKGADLVRLHEAAFRPEHATVAIAGDIDRASAVALVEKHLGNWVGKALPKKAYPDPRSLGKDEKRVLLIDRPGSSQSSVSLALVGISRKHPDFDAVMVLNTLLGGQFSSRLNMNLREKNAYTYGAYSWFDTRRVAGPFTAGGAIMTPATAPAIREMFAEMERLRKELPPAVELENAKTNLIRKLPARFETASGTAQALGSLSVMGLALDEFATRQSRVAKVTAEDVRRVANTYLRSEAMRVIIVGDASVVQKELEALDLGGIEVRHPVEQNPPSSRKPASKK